LNSPMPGTVVKVHVERGQMVGAHEPLLVLEAMKMEHVIDAPFAGRIEEVMFQAGDMVPRGAVLVRMDPT
jgi:3-methylcrotonyl-CoA carboxylase alpha subunit